MRENREVALSFVFSDEGGYILRPDGGMANMGIGLHTLYDYRKRHKLNIPTYWDIEHLEKEEAGAIYGELFFDRCRFDELVSGVDYVVADTAVNLGVSGCAELIQSKFNLNSTRKFDDETIQYLNTRDVQEVIQGIRDAWIERKRKQPLYGTPDAKGKTRGPGWENRDKRVRDRAMKLAGF